MESNEPIEQLNNEIVNNVISNSVVIGKKEDLPKYTLPKGERLYLSRDQLSTLNDKYYQILSDLKEGRDILPAELRSIMESVIGKAYLEEIEDLRLDNRLPMDRERERKMSLIVRLTPRTRRSWFFRQKRNQSQILLDELVERQAAQYLQDRADELPVIDGSNEGLSFEVLIDILLQNLPRLRKKRRQTVNDVVQQLYDSYNRKKEETKRLAEALEEKERRLDQALERAQAAEECLDEFLKESTPESKESGSDVETRKNEQTEAENEMSKEQERTGAEQDEQSSETIDTGEEEENDPADEEEEDSLSYDGLDEADGQE